MREVTRWETDKSLINTALKVMDLLKGNTPGKSFHRRMGLELKNIEITTFQTKMFHGIELKKVLAPVITTEKSLHPNKPLIINRIVRVKEFWDKEDRRFVEDVSTKYAIVITDVDDKIDVEFGVFEIRDNLNYNEKGEETFKQTEINLMHSMKSKTLKHKEEIDGYINTLLLRRAVILKETKMPIIEMLSVTDNSEKAIRVTNEKYDDYIEPNEEILRLEH